MKLCNKVKFNYHSNEYYVDVYKEFNFSDNIDYYVYNVYIYVKKDKYIFFPYKYVWSWNTYWLDYTKYHGDIDKVIFEALENCENNIKEQKYINKKEIEYKFK
jgi:hypothetical protein